MKLDLGHIREARTRFDRTFDPAQVQMADDAYRIVAPVRLGIDIHKDRNQLLRPTEFQQQIEDSQTEEHVPSGVGVEELVGTDHPLEAELLADTQSALRTTALRQVLVLQEGDRS